MKHFEEPKMNIVNVMFEAVTNETPEVSGWED